VETNIDSVKVIFQKWNNDH